MRWIEVSVTLTGHISPNSALHEQIQRIFGRRGQRAIHPKRAGAMAHGVKLEIAERDFLHFAVGRMIIDPVLVAAEPIACIQDRRTIFAMEAHLCLTHVLQIGGSTFNIVFQRNIPTPLV